MARILISAACGPMFPELADSLPGHALTLIDSAPWADDVPGVTPVRWWGQGYAEDVARLIIERDIEVYVPLIDEELQFAHTTGCKVIAPSPEFIASCLDKESCMQYLRDLRLSYIKVEHGHAFKGPYPAFVKPITGRGSRGVALVRTAEEFEAHCLLSGYRKQDLLVQESLEGPEYTVSVTVSHANGLVAVVPKLVLEKRGITRWAQTNRQPAIEALCRAIVEAMRPCGPFNVQLKLVDGVPKVFEINPRLSTTTVLTTAAGINEIEECLEHWEERYVGLHSFANGRGLVRRWANHFYAV